MDEWLSYTTTWLNLTNIILSESRKRKSYIIAIRSCPKQIKTNYSVREVTYSESGTEPSERLEGTVLGMHKGLRIVPFTPGRLEKLINHRELGRVLRSIMPR